MSKRTFFIKAIWDEKKRIFRSESDIKGLFIVTETLEEFKEVAAHFALDLILSNHVSQEELMSMTLRDLLPIIMFETQVRQAAEAAA